MVLIREDNLPRLSWPLGVIVETFPGNDGIIRAVSVKTSKGVFTRPIQKLHDLELDSQVSMERNLVETPESVLVEPPVVPNSQCDNTPRTTKSGRQVKAPQKLNL